VAGPRVGPMGDEDLVAFESAGPVKAHIRLREDTLEVPFRVRRSRRTCEVGAGLVDRVDLGVIQVEQEFAPELRLLARSCADLDGGSSRDRQDLPVYPRRRRREPDLARSLDRPHSCGAHDRLDERASGRVGLRLRFRY
jgi:hypothetical protein